MEGVAAHAARSAPGRSDRRDSEKLRSISEIADTHFQVAHAGYHLHAGFGEPGSNKCSDELCARAEAAVREVINIVIRSDRMAGSGRIRIP